MTLGSSGSSKRYVRDGAVTDPGAPRSVGGAPPDRGLGGGDGQRLERGTRTHLLFKLGGTEHKSILVVNVLPVNFWLFTSPSRYIVSKSVLCFLYSVKKYNLLSLHTLYTLSVLF